jgi:cytochrome P450
VVKFKYAVMQSNYFVHTDENIWPEPFKFNPQRWLDDPKLTRHLVAFGRGSRSCLGMNLGYAELYLAIAYLFRRFKFELHDTTEDRDIKVKRDTFIGLPDKSSKGVRVKVAMEYQS